MVTIFMLCFTIYFIHGYKIAHVSSHFLIRYWMSNMASDAKTCFSSKVEYRAVIRYLYLKDKTGKEMHGELTNVHGSSAPSYAQVKFWVGEFKHSRMSLEDEARSGRPLDATDEEMCKKVRDLVYSDRQIQVEEIVQALGISHGSVSTILHDRLGKRKLTARWVPKSLSDKQMATRASVCSVLLKRFRSKDDFLLHLVTVDETWVHYYEPENKAQRRQWVGPGSPRPKKCKTQPSAGKVMATVFGTQKALYYVGLFTQEKYNNWSELCKLVRPAVKSAEVNSLKVFCCNRTTQESTLAKLQWKL